MSLAQCVLAAAAAYTCRRRVFPIAVLAFASVCLQSWRPPAPLGPEPRCISGSPCVCRCLFATIVPAEMASTSGRSRLGPNDFELLRIVGQVRLFLACGLLAMLT